MLRFVGHCVFISRILSYSHDLTYVLVYSLAILSLSRGAELGPHLPGQGGQAPGSPRLGGGPGSGLFHGPGWLLLVITRIENGRSFQRALILNSHPLKLANL